MDSYWKSSDEYFSKRRLTVFFHESVRKIYKFIVYIKAAQSKAALEVPPIRFFFIGPSCRTFDGGSDDVKHAKI